MKQTQINHHITVSLCAILFFPLSARWPTTQELVAHIKDALEAPKSMTSENEGDEGDSQSQLEKALVARMLLDCAERKADDAHKQELKELREQLDEAVYTSLVDCMPTKGRRQQQRPRPRPSQHVVVPQTPVQQEPQQQIVSNQETVRDPSFRNALVTDKLTVGSLDAKQTAVDDLIVRGQLVVPTGFTTHGDSEHLNSLWVDNTIKGGVLDIAGQTTVRGPLYLGPTAQTITNVSPLLNDGVTVGVLTGGLLSAQKLTASVSAGTGYLKALINQTDALQYVVWPALTITLQPSADNFVYINQQAKAVVATTPLSDERLIFVGKVRTSATDALFVQRIAQQAKHMANKLAQVVEGAFGPLYGSGLVVSQSGAVGLQVSSGQYYWGTHQFNPQGGANISWLAFCGTNNTFVAQQTAVDYQQYDNQGTLTKIPDGKYARHLMCVMGDGDVERYVLVYGQKYFEDPAHAEVGDIPKLPDSWTGNILPIASIIVKNDAQAPLVKILDEKPRHGVVVNSVSGTEHHGNLMDLGQDQHKQYLLVNGTRPMVGPLDMGNQSIVNVRDINGVPLVGRAQLDELAARVETLSASVTKHEPQVQVARDIETQQAIPIPAFGMTGMSTRVAQRVYEGGIYYLLRDVTFKKIVFRTTEVTAPGALSMGIYQTATGSSGVGTLVASVQNFVPSVAGATTQIVPCKEGTVTLKAGAIYVLFGRTTAAGSLTLRTYTCPDIDLVTNGTAYGFSLSFATSISSATPLPTIFNPAQALSANGNHVAPIIRFVG